MARVARMKIPGLRSWAKGRLKYGRAIYSLHLPAFAGDLRIMPEPWYPQQGPVKSYALWWVRSPDDATKMTRGHQTRGEAVRDAKRWVRENPDGAPYAQNPLTRGEQQSVRMRGSMWTATDPNRDPYHPAWREYDSAVEWVARRGGKGAVDEPLPGGLSSVTHELINDDPEAFEKRVREFAYGITMEGRQNPLDADEVRQVRGYDRRSQMRERQAHHPVTKARYAGMGMAYDHVAEEFGQRANPRVDFAGQRIERYEQYPGARVAPGPSAGSISITPRRGTRHLPAISADSARIEDRQSPAAPRRRNPARKAPSPTFQLRFPKRAFASATAARKSALASLRRIYGPMLAKCPTIKSARWKTTGAGLGQWVFAARKRKS